METNRSEKLGSYEHALAMGEVVVAAVVDTEEAQRRTAFMANLLEAGGGMPGAARAEITVHVASDVFPHQTAIMALEASQVALQQS